MEFYKIYNTKEHIDNISHLKNLFSIAKIDGNISKEEEEMLNIYCKKYNISDDEYKTISESNINYEIHTEYSKEERYEKYFNLVKIVLSDGTINKLQIKLLEKISIGLGYHVSKSKLLFAETVKQILLEKDFSSSFDEVEKIIYN